MSQKAGRKSKKLSTEEPESGFKQPNSVNVHHDEPKSNEVIEENGKTETNGTEEKEKTDKRVTRNRSSTPLKKKKHDVEEDSSKNGDVNEKPKESDPAIIIEHVEKEEVVIEKVIKINTEQENGISTEETKKEEEANEMDPLILADEPDPELQFDETSEAEEELKNEKESPVLSRCVTRRSQTRNIPTPKTPKSMDESEIDLNVSFENCSENVSTQVEVGSDSTRVDFADNDENSFLSISKNKSFVETLKCISSRPTIRPISNDYRKTVLTRSVKKSDLNSTYPLRRSVERVSVGRKRKASTESLEDINKRQRVESSNDGFFARLTQPLGSFRKLRPSSSTPRLTAYKDDHVLVENKVKNEEVNKKNWCSIM